MNARVTALAVTVSGVLVVAFSALVGRSSVLVWNASESVPAGLYRVQPAGRIAIDDLVAVQPPERLAQFLSEGKYLPRGAPMLKHVAALGGQTACREGVLVTIDGDAVGVARKHDGRGRLLPDWQGCHVLRDDEFFPMNAAPESLDGRYLGSLPRSAIIGKATLLWTPNDD